MKKYFAIILSIILCLSLFGCGKNDVSTGNSESIGGEQSVETVSPSESKAEGTTEIYSETAPEKPSAEIINVISSVANKPNPVESQTSTSKPSTQGSVTQAQTQAPAKPTESESKPSKKITCTVGIECGVILNNEKKFKKDISIVPQGGVILAPTSVTADEGATAYDVLKIVCRQNGISLNEKSSSLGMYIVGIGEINEKDCGNTSGWVYTVNGQSPNVSMDKYKLKSGDSLQLSYVC